METKWNLDNIYTSVDSEEFRSDVKEFKERLAELNSWCETAFDSNGNAEKLICEYIVMKNRLMSSEKLLLYVNLALSVDTSDEKLASALDMLEKLWAENADNEARFSEYIRNVKNIDEIISKNPLLSEHGYFLKECEKKAKHTLSPKEELIISRLKSTGSSLWEKQWEQLTSGLVISFECQGKKYREPLSSVRNMAYSENAELRKAAYEAELGAYEKINVPAAFCMNGIKGQVICESNMRGYDSPLEMTLEDSRLDSEVLECMWSAAYEALPELTEYFTSKAELLGYEDKKLPFYELFAPVGKDLSYTLEEARDTVIKSFYGFSEEMGAFAKGAFDNRWIDLMPKEGKTGGAFCEAIHPIKESRILTNFGGTFNDVVTIAHELGHAFHDSRLYEVTPLNSFYPMPLAETASTFCETVVINEALKDADENGALVIVENDLQGIMQTLSDIYSRFLFEDSVFRLKGEGTFFTAEGLCDLMEKAQKKAYGGTLSEKYLHSYMWLCKPHYYDADFNYYNFPYAFGMLLSKALYGKYTEMGDKFIPIYDEFLRNAALKSPAEAAKAAGFDLADREFWNSGLKAVKEEIELFKNMVRKR